MFNACDIPITLKSTTQWLPGSRNPRGPGSHTAGWASPLLHRAGLGDQGIQPSEARSGRPGMEAGFCLLSLSWITCSGEPSPCPEQPRDKSSGSRTKTCGHSQRGSHLRASLGLIADCSPFASSLQAPERPEPATRPPGHPATLPPSHPATRPSCTGPWLSGALRKNELLLFAAANFWGDLSCSNR